MALSKIKNEFLKTTVAFGNSGFPLGMRDDIDDLAIMAHESGDSILINFFEHLPPLAELKKSKLEAGLSHLTIPRLIPAVDTSENDKDNNDKKSLQSESESEEGGNKNVIRGNGSR